MTTPELIPALESVFAGFSEIGKACFATAYISVLWLVKEGHSASAKLAVQMIAIPSEVPGVPAEELATWPAKKAEILALFP